MVAIPYSIFKLNAENPMNIIKKVSEQRDDNLILSELVSEESPIDSFVKASNRAKFPSEN